MQVINNVQSAIKGLVWLIAIVLILIGIVISWKFFWDRENLTVPKTLDELAVLATPIKCEYRVNRSDIEPFATIVAVQGYLRLDNSEDVHLIMRLTDNEAYSWNGVYGARAAIDYENDHKEYAQPETSVEACTAWIPDSTLFTPPAEVDITDFSELQLLL
jgi:hypothetical protein